MLKVKTDLGCRIYVDDNYIGIAMADRINKFDIIKGEYWVRFESLTDSSVFMEKAVQILEWDKLEIIQLRPLMHRFVLIPFANNNLWGYAELFSGLEIVAPVYSSAENFSNGYAIARKGDRFGLVAEDGTEALSCLYEAITRIWDNCFIIESDNKFALFNPTVPSKLSSFYDEWDFVWNYEDTYGNNQSRPKENGIIVVKKNDLCGIYDCLNNRELLPCEYTSIGYPRSSGRRLAKKQDSFTILARNCEPIGIIPDSSKYKGFGSSGEYVFLNSDGKWGIFDLKGNTIIPCRFDAIANSFHNGLIRVGHRQLRDGKWVMLYGFINEKGEEIIPCIYDSALGFSNDITFVSLYDKEKWMYAYKFRDLFINKQGEIISEIRRTITSIYPFYKGVALCKWKLKGYRDDYYCMITENGTIICDISFLHNKDYYGHSNDWTSEFFENGFHEVVRGGYTVDDEDVFSYDVPFEFGVIGIDGKMIVPYKYSSLRYIDGIFDSFDKNGKPIKRRIPDSERVVICGIKKKEHDRYGLLGRDGKEIIPCDFENIQVSIDRITLKTRAWVKKDGMYALFDSKTGEQLTSYMFDDISHDFCEGRAFVLINGCVAVINDTGSIIYNSTYSLASKFLKDEICSVSTESGLALLAIDSLKLYPCDEKFNSFCLEKGLLKLRCYKEDGLGFSNKWTSEIILDAKTGLVFLPETAVKLKTIKEKEAFLAQL